MQNFLKMALLIPLLWIFGAPAVSAKSFYWESCLFDLPRNLYSNEIPETFNARWSFISTLHPKADKNGMVNADDELRAAYLKTVNSLVTEIEALPPSLSTFERVVRELKLNHSSLLKCHGILEITDTPPIDIDSLLKGHLLSNIDILYQASESFILQKLSSNEAGNLIARLEIILGNHDVQTAFQTNKPLLFQNLKDHIALVRDQLSGNFMREGDNSSAKCLVLDSEIQPSSFHKVSFPYPEKALDSEIEGFAEIEFQIDEKGNVISAEFSQVSNEVFRSENDLRKLYDVKFFPKLENCLPSGGEFKRVFLFKLD